MCSENQNDIPIRSLIVQSQQGWTAHCLDFNLQAHGGEPEDALDLLDEAISAHLKKARAGETPLFVSAREELWKLYFQAAEAKLMATGPGHGHVEHRPLMLDPIPV